METQCSLHLPPALKLTSQTMDIVALSSKYSYSGKGIGIKYSEFVFVALVFQYKTRMPLLYCNP